MRFLNPWRRGVPAEPVARVSAQGTKGLLVFLHGYGSDERQFESLVRLELPVVEVTPRAPIPVDPGFGWWEPEPRIDGLLELAPEGAMADAMGAAAASIRKAQGEYGFTPQSTVVLGYSQGASLALLLAARRPGLVAGVVAAAGFLVSDERVVPTKRGRGILVMNGTLDPLIGEAEHGSTVDRLRAAGHRVSERRDPIPHVIDTSQVPVIKRFVEAALGLHGTTTSA